MIKYKEIKLLPTDYTLDVWVCENQDEVLFETLREYYGSEVNYHNRRNYVFACDLDIGKYYMRQLVMVLNTLSPLTLSHEILHVMWTLSDLSKIEMTTHSQEWQACMLESIMEQCLYEKNYEIYK